MRSNNVTIYNINFGIGWASSGVEYAQAYRAKLLRKIDNDTKFIFLDFIQYENIQTLTNHIGFLDEEIIWLYQYFTDIKISPTIYTIDNLKQDIGLDVTYEEHIDKIKRLYLGSKHTYVTCFLKNSEEDIVDRAEFVVNNILIRKDFYSYVRIFSEYYAPYDNKAKLYMRQFYNEDGTIAYNEYIDDDSVLYSIKEVKLYSKAEFVAYFIKKLNLTFDDIIILDRATHIGQAVLQNKGNSHVGVVIHAEHFSENSTNDMHILWNNYYEYQFSNAKEIDFFITATELQEQILREQFEKYYNFIPRIRTIPVGFLEELKYPKHCRKPYSMISASRLASEKHVDWLVLAAIKAKTYIPELSLDIYGEGAEKANLEKIINEHDANSYIKLKGHTKLDDIYADYRLFVSASTSEGFGLTLMEAVGSGLGMIGFDVNYGNPTFIRDNQNGYLIPLSLKNNEKKEIVNKLSEYMVKYFKDDLVNAQNISYEIAGLFTKHHIEERWRSLIKEVLYD